MGATDRILRLAALTAALAVLLGPAAPALGQSGNRALIVLDASKSMNEDAGNGASRLDAAKRAVDALVERLPARAPVGLRVYGAKVAEASRTAGCRDTELQVPVGLLDKAALRERVDVLVGRGRTPIGRSLLAAPDDLGAGPGRRFVILVSDGGDNCAPPDPCRAARTVSRQGLDLSISVVGLQVNERVRRQLQCIARAGGGDYLDVQDAGKLGDELAAALARAFRSYLPSGTEVSGGGAPAQAMRIGTGLFQDALQPGEQRWYAIDLRGGQRLFTAATAIPSRTASGNGELQVTLQRPDGGEVDSARDVLSGAAAGELGRVQTESLRTAGPAGAGDVPAGSYRLGVAIARGDLAPAPVPVEIAVQAVGSGQLPALVRAPGTIPTGGSPPPPGRATPVPTGGGGEGQGSGGLSWAAVIGIGAVAALIGLAATFAMGRRRTA